jgi:hypothetical protein
MDPTLDAERSTTPPLNSTIAHASVVGDPATVYAAAYNLIERLWPGTNEIVLADPPRLLMHRVSSGGDDVDAWLTWDFRPAGPSSSWTELRLVHEELDTSAGPPPELDHVLALLGESLRVAREYE